MFTIGASDTFSVQTGIAKTLGRPSVPALRTVILDGDFIKWVNGFWTTRVSFS